MNPSELDLVILKNILSNKKHALDFASKQDAKLFSPEIWNFANIVISYIKTYKDVPTLKVITERLSKGNNDKLIESCKKIWSQVEATAFDDKEYNHELDKIKKRFAEKQLIALKDKLSKVDGGNSDIPLIMGEIQKTLQSIKDISKNKSYDSKNIKDYLPFFVDKFNAKKNNPDIEVGLKTKYSFIDFATNGLKPADFMLICGESGFGKSLLLQNIAVQSWMQDNTIEMKENFYPGKDIAYFSLEMPYEDCFNRLISRLAGVPSRKIENASLSKEEFSKVKAALDFIKNYPNQFKIIDIQSACSDDLDKILDESECKYDAVFVDYLGIMKTNAKSEEDDWLKQGMISEELRGLARKYEVPIFSAVQLNRKKQGKEPGDNIGLSRLARSGTIATHATHVLQIDSSNNPEYDVLLNVYIIKNRKGPKLKGVLYKDLACATLIDKAGEENQYNDIFTDQDDISADLEEIENLEI